MLNKPFDALAQLSDDQGRATLKDFVDVSDFYLAGRLDRDSEGLLLLTNDGRCNRELQILGTIFPRPIGLKWKANQAQSSCSVCGTACS